MSARIAIARIGPEPLDVTEHAAAVAGDSCGAVVTFAGVVRDVDDGRPVSSIEYVCHPTAADVLGEVVADVLAGRDPEAVAVSHRVGLLQVGDVAFVVAVAGMHRKEAFETATALVDEVKARLPVWKHQFFMDGSDEWVGSA